MTPRPRKCVRCGEAPRHGDTFLCSECQCSWVAHREIATALTADPEHPRLWLRQNGWHGGWPGKDTPITV